MSFRLKEEFEKVDLDLLSYRLAPDDDVIVQVRSDALTGDVDALNWQTPQNHDPDETGVEVIRTDHASNFDINAGRFRFQDIAPGGQGSRRGLAQVEDVDTEVRRRRPITVAARRSGSGSTTVAPAMVSWVEGW